MTDVTINSNSVLSKTSYKSSLKNIFGIQVKNYTIGDEVKAVGDYAFYQCSGLTSVTIPNSVTTIGNCAFDKCSSLTSVTIPNSVTSIGDYAFSDCSGLTSITIPNSVTSIGDGAISDCSGLTSITIPNSVTSIGDYAFYECTRLTSITIPNSVTSVGGHAFGNCTNLTDVTINSNSVLSKSYSSSSSIKDIFGTQVKKYTIGDEVKSIGRYAFSECEAIESIVFPNGMTTIGEYAFSGCSSLATVVIPNTVTSIGEKAFANCLSLYSVTSLINMPFNLDKTAFQYTGTKYDKNIVYMAATLYVPRGRTAMYKNIQGWQIFMNIMETDTKFKLTYVVDGEIYKTYEIQATEVITPEPDPYKEGFTFSGWSDIPYLMPAENVTITGSFSVDPDYQTGMESVGTDRATSIAIYSLGGHRMNGPQRGLNIVRMSDGTVRKVVVR